MANCFDVADFFIANPNSASPMTNLKLQKLCSYAKAFSMVLLGTPIFSNLLVAFPYGPVVPELYEKYKSHRDRPLPPVDSRRDVRAPFTDEELFVLETVNGYYGTNDAYELKDMSHEDFPGKFGSRAVIPDSQIRERFESNAVIKAIQEGY